MSLTRSVLALAPLIAFAACQPPPQPGAVGQPAMDPATPQAPASAAAPPTEATGTRSPDSAADAVTNSYSGAVPNAGSANAPPDALPREKLPPDSPQ